MTAEKMNMEIGEIKNLLIEIRDLLKGQPGEFIAEESTSNEVSENQSIEDWLNEKNSLVEEQAEETADEPEVIFQVLDGVDPTGMEEYIGKPLSEVPSEIIEMIGRPDYAKKFAPKKFPQEVIDACVRLGV